MTKNKYTHNGVTYIGLTSYNFGEMLYQWTTMGSCSAYLVTRTAFCNPKYKGEYLKCLVVYARNELECRMHLTKYASAEVHEVHEGLKAYIVKPTILYPAVCTLINLCKPKRSNKRRIILTKEK